MPEIVDWDEFRFDFVTSKGIPRPQLDSIFEFQLLIFCSKLHIGRKKSGRVILHTNKIISAKSKHCQLNSKEVKGN